VFLPIPGTNNKWRITSRDDPDEPTMHYLTFDFWMETWGYYMPGMRIEYEEGGDTNIRMTGVVIRDTSGWEPEPD
jgi:hypothetical protein